MGRTPSILGLVAAVLAGMLAHGCGDEVVNRTIVSPLGGDGSGLSPFGAPSCGDRVLQAGEECDDGGRKSGDGCDWRCRKEVCGNGRIDAGEMCDDGNEEDGDGCSDRCRLEVDSHGPRDGSGDLPLCGDDTLQRGEECDDGGRVSGDGCDWRCRTEVCGNGRLDAGEKCDDGNTESGDGCTGRCRLESGPRDCGDGAVDSQSEECDDGNVRSGDGCDWRCRIERCGNRRIDAGEECDPPVEGQCTDTCDLLLKNCGDGTVQAQEGEACDDGNSERGDGCAECRYECGDGLLERDIGEECEIVHALEGTCNGSTCKRLAACGNGKVEPQVGEQCDPSDDLACIGCRIQVVGDGDGGDGDGGGDGDSGMCMPSPEEVERVHNGDFALDVEGWTARTRVDVSHDAGQGASADGSLRTAFGAMPGESGRETSGAYQCVPVEGGIQYGLHLMFLIPAGSSAEIAARAHVYLHSSNDCSDKAVAAPAMGASQAVGSWTPYERQVVTDPTTRALQLQLNVSKPRAVEGVILWDDVSIRRGSANPLCGNCDLDANAGEECDDGNRDVGDGCAGNCQLETCGNGTVDGGEDCDDGARYFGDATDGCTASCALKSECDECAGSKCGSEVDACLNLTGQAAAGPRAGVTRAVLCEELRNCIHATGCDGPTAVSGIGGFGGVGQFIENCYCGNAGTGCFDGAANGSCRAQVEAALETTDPVRILDRMGGAIPEYPLFGAVNDLRACEQDACPSVCKSTLTCGNAIRQDRSVDFPATYLFDIGGVLAPCSDARTSTGYGCSLEECDDGNEDNGDGCDEDCFVEVCGNNVLQTGEECDDGNRSSGDGCGADCVAEFACGDGVAEAPFEQCDPPASGPVCTQAQFAANPSQCGCDPSCRRIVCGDGWVQEGEQCDPPSPVCSDTCQLLEDECTKCIRAIDLDVADATGSGCLAGLELDGTGIAGDFYERGCVEDEACYDLWTCIHETGCHLNRPIDCYCGIGVEPNTCEVKSYVPVGPCVDEVLAAFEAQVLFTPDSNSEVFEQFFETFAASGYASLGFANDLASQCLVADGPSLVPSTRELFVAAGMNASEVDAYMSACFP